MTIILYYYKEDKLKITNESEVIDKLYYQEAHVPTIQQIKSAMSKSDIKSEIKIFLENKSPIEAIENIKKSISRIDNKIPLYDEITRNMYLINRENVYRRVVYEYYRFPDEQLIKIFKDRLYELDKEQQESELTDTKKIRYNKLKLMIDFLEQFNLEILKTTYIKVFYYYANEVGKNITVCLRPSFLPHLTHIRPYYTRSELINMALNLEIITPSKVYYDEDKLMNLCDAVKKNDISADTITQHQMYIIDNEKVGVVQYYSLQGSYFMNQYLRGIVSYKYKNTLLEDNIRSMWELINDAPEFDKSYTLYRFIKNDAYLKELSVGDKYVEPSFISTTRDPFYRSETYKFGFILIKIKIPKGQRGVALCIETVSQFPEEQEIILSPLSILRLDKIDDKVPYYHTDDMYETKIKTRYEFTYVGKAPIKFISRPMYDKEDIIVDFLKIDKIDAITVKERIKSFIRKYVNDMYQFKTYIGDNLYTILVEWYDSTDVYKKFFAARTDDGFMMYTLINNYLGFTIEIGEDSDNTYMYVNYYFRYSSVPKIDRVGGVKFIEFLSKIAYYFNIKMVILYCEYNSCSFINKKMYGGNYCKDIYDYLKYGTKRYTIDSTELKPAFSYYELDRLRSIDPSKILIKQDRDELYQIYNKTYSTKVNKSEINLANYYIWLVENYCLFSQKLVEKMPRLYNIDNPFIKDYYILDTIAYLYNRNYIDDFPTYTSDTIFIKSKTTDEVPKNRYRLTYSADRDIEQE